ncbi:MAG: type IX secretion system protein PorQ [Bacteroidia bacterium]|nr:type IX secretion system protein PorQ [Bacteroidia bacterium]
MKRIAIFLLLFAGLKSEAQIGGTKTYRFLDLPMTARSAALGGNNMSIWGNDINLLYNNPGLLNSGMVKQAGINYCFFVGDMRFFSAAYAHSLKDKGMVAGSINTFNYGNFNGYDEMGNATNKFNASDYSINLNYAKSLADSSFNVGLCLKTIVSQYDVYKSFGNALDFGIVYHPKKNLVVSLQARNVGFIWKSYSGQSMNSNDLPRTVQLGASYKPSNAPFRFFMVYDQLLKWNMQYISPIDTTGKNSTLGSSETKKDSSGWQKFKVRTGDRADNLMRHIVFGAEVSLSKNFHLRLAYNYRRQKEMTLPEKRGTAGLSFGFGLKIKRFSFSYAFTKMAMPGSSNIIGLTYHW